MSSRKIYTDDFHEFYMIFFYMENIIYFSFFPTRGFTVRKIFFTHYSVRISYTCQNKLVSSKTPSLQLGNSPLVISICQKMCFSASSSEKVAKLIKYALRGYYWVKLLHICSCT